MNTVPKRKNLAAGFLAVAVHGFFVLLLVLGVSWQIHDPQPVMAELWQAMPTPPRPAPPPPPEPAPPEPAPPPKAPPPEPRPVPENKPADIGLEKKKQQELLKQKEAQAALQKKREEEKRREEARRAELEKKDAARKEAEKKLAEQKQREALRREEEDLQRRMLEEALASEASQREASAAAARRASEMQSLIARYQAMIRDKIRGNTRLPENLPGNPEAEFQLSVLPTGEITKVQLTRSSGNAAYDQAVLRGIEKSSPLPMPPDKSAAAEFRNLVLKHKARE